MGEKAHGLYHNILRRVRAPLVLRLHLVSCLLPPSIVVKCGGVVLRVVVCVVVLVVSCVVRCCSCCVFVCVTCFSSYNCCCDIFSGCANVFRAWCKYLTVQDGRGGARTLPRHSSSRASRRWARPRRCAAILRWLLADTHLGNRSRAERWNGCGARYVSLYICMDTYIEMYIDIWIYKYIWI